MENIIKELAKYFDTELFYVKVGLEKETDLIQRSHIAWYCTQRCLGAAQFANQMGVDYGIIEAMFEGVKEKIKTLENTY